MEKQEKKNKDNEKDLLKTNDIVKNGNKKINSMDDLKNLEKENANALQDITKNPKNYYET